MKVKGTAFIARKSMLVPEIGEARWDALVAEVSEKEPAFRRPILASTVLPIEGFLRLQDEIVRQIYGGDEKSYFDFGEKSAQWSLTQGPYKHLVKSKSYEQFARLARGIYANYFTEGEATSEVIDNLVRLRIHGVPKQHHHAYFEYAICGYFKRGLELVSGKPVVMKAIRGFTRGDSDVFYEFRPA